MNIDWLHFTPYSALLGGALIGLSAALLLLVNGRILGISGILGGLLSGLITRLVSAPAKKSHITPQADWTWRLCLLAGIATAPWVYSLFAPLPAVELAALTPSAATPTSPPLWLYSIAGLLVGIGTRYGAGCTSGHGVCGLGRFSKRSLVATLCFMGSGIATVYVLRHGWMS
jgi:uncharacterized membrane protein YedE/YeeE